MLFSGISNPVIRIFVHELGLNFRPVLPISALGSCNLRRPVKSGGIRTRAYRRRVQNLSSGEIPTMADHKKGLVHLNNWALWTQYEGSCNPRPINHSGLRRPKSPNCFESGRFRAKHYSKIDKEYGCTWRPSL